MDFIYRPKSNEARLVHICVEQNVEMWSKGYITLHHKGWITYAKIKELKPVYEALEPPEPQNLTKEVLDAISK